MWGLFVDWASSRFSLVPFLLGCLLSLGRLIDLGLGSNDCLLSLLQALLS